MMRYDLHSHSTASDGTLAPRDLVLHAVRQAVDVLALTDHDTTEGLAEAATAAAETGVNLVPGVEISVTWERQLLHIVGLGIDPACSVLHKGLLGLRTIRVDRAQLMAQRLARCGIQGAFEGAMSHTASATAIGRTHFARFLVAGGHARDMNDAFRRYLAQGRPGYAPGQWAALEEAVGWIRAAGGQAVIAHPARYRLTATKLRALLEAFKACGGVGMEVVSGTPSLEEMALLAGYVRRDGLLASVGSDYHGPGQSMADLGRIAPLPAGCAPIWDGWPVPVSMQAAG